MAHGGSAVGYALHLQDGKPVFTVRENSQPVAITSSAVPAGSFHLEARLARNGTLTLTVNGKTVATGQAPGLIPHQPQEDFCVGHDNGAAVGDYDGTKTFAGTLTHLKVVAE